MITSRLTNEGQTTIPQPVRAALDLREGDQLAYAIEADHVILTCIRPAGIATDPFQCFSEWHSAADAVAYADL